MLNLIFLEYISDAFYELYRKLKEDKRGCVGEDLGDRGKYNAGNVFFVPLSSRWQLLFKTKQPATGHTVDKALEAIEKENPPPKVQSFVMPAD